MTYVPYEFPVLGGMDRTIAPGHTDRSSFYTMYNLRQSRNRGSIETTPRFKTSQVAQQNYWNGGSTAEPATTPLTFADGKIYMTEYTANYNFASQIICIERTVYPSGFGPTKGCLFTFVNDNLATVTLGNSYDIEIDSATTFKWRVNGGGYTAGVVIDSTSGNLIDSGGVRLYWLTNTGFTIGNVWTFQRTERTRAKNPFSLQLSIVKGDGGRYFYIDSAYLVHVIEPYPTPVFLTYYIRPLGYFPTYARKLVLFEKHLFLLESSFTGTSYTAGYIQSSDLNAPDNFYATDTNEADQFTLPVSAFPSIWTSVNGIETLDGFVLNNRLFVVTNYGIYYTDYSGLPVPFSFKLFINWRPNAYTLTTHTCRYGVFISTARSLYLFNGNEIKVIIQDYWTQFGVSQSLYSTFFMFYHGNMDELIIGFTGVWLVYQIEKNSFYQRSVSFSATDNYTGVYVEINSAATKPEPLYVWGGSRSMYYEDVLNNSTGPSMDSSSGTAYAVPKLTTHLIVSGGLSKVKETNPVYVGWTPITGAGSGYTSQATTTIALQYYTSTDGLISGSPAGTETLVIASVPLFTQHRLNYRGLAYEITFPNGAGPKPCTPLSIQSIETQEYRDMPTR